jgi:ribosomal protein S18 acetylase RimI-like enzyme
MTQASRPLIKAITTDEALAIADRFVAVYREVFSQPPYSETEDDVGRFAGQFARHSTYPGFRCVIATEGRNLLGFAYGYLGQSGQYWHDHVRTLLDPALHQRWVKGSFEFVELGVVSCARGRGIGGRLHDRLLDVATRTAVLSTSPEDTTAKRLYQKRGWVTLYRGVWSPGSDYEAEIMGLDLTAARNR